MTLRLKVVLVVACLTALATATIGVVSYVGISNRLQREVDRSLDDAAREITEHAERDGRGPDYGERDLGEPIAPLDQRPPSFEQILVQYLDSTGSVTSAPAGLDLPVGDGDLVVASGAATESRRDVSIDGAPYRVLTIGSGSQGGAVQLARSLAETNRLLDSLQLLTIAATFVVTAIAAAIGWLLARQITRRLTLLTGAAEHVAETGALDVDIPTDGHDEAARLGGAFSGMLDALARSRDAQQRLVQDAGHELRTPLTSLRTNVSVLQRHHDLPPETAQRVLDQIDDEAHQLTDLVNEIVELATDRRDQEPATDIELGTIVERVAERARKRSGRRIDVVADHSVVHARPGAVDRAVANLIDNALKFDAESDHHVEITVHAGRVEVCDRGPGIADDDLAHVFDRFYRSAGARRQPGSGLGLSIVRQVAEDHQGSVFASNRPDGGARIGFELPTR